MTSKSIPPKRTERMRQILRDLPNPDNWLWRVGTHWHASTAWLVGPVYSQVFSASSETEAIEAMIAYLDHAIMVKSLHSQEARRAGWPNLDDVGKWLADQVSL